MTDSADGVVIAFPGVRPDRLATVPLEDAGLSLIPDPEPVVPRSKPRPSKPGRSPEHARALEIAALYKVKQPVCDSRHAARAILAAIKASMWSDGAIVAAVERLGDAGWSLTPNTLNIELRKGDGPKREIDPHVHEAVDAALGHLNALDSEQMTETERRLAAAMRQICIAVMHKAADAA